MVVAASEGQGADQAIDINRLIADVERLRGKLRISVRRTEDGLGIHIPPARHFGLVAFLSLWLCGWAAGEVFAISQMLAGGLGFPDLFLLIWIVPWTIGGAWVIRTIGWQLFGIERLFFTANALVREWSVLGFGGRRVVHGADIVSVAVYDKMSNDFAGLGTIKVETTEKPLRIGRGLEGHEAELVATMIRQQAAGGVGRPRLIVGWRCSGLAADMRLPQRHVFRSLQDSWLPCSPDKHGGAAARACSVSVRDRSS